MKPATKRIKITVLNFTLLFVLFLHWESSLLAQYKNYTRVMRDNKMKFDLSSNQSTISSIPVSISDKKGAILNDPLTDATPKAPKALPLYATSDPLVISGIINKYTAVKDICGQSFQVEAPNKFAPGEVVMVIQMQGASIDISNTPEFGTITDYGSAGMYELNVIESVNGDKIVFQRKLLNKYDAGGSVQLVSVPNLGDATLGDLSCPQWDGSTGGVLAFQGGNITLSGAIDVSGKGFRGGENLPEGQNYAYSVGYKYPESAKGVAAFKGEGIAKLFPDIVRGKGSNGSGGGGGNEHNAGGGGGANGGTGGFGGIFWYYQIVPETRGIGGKNLDYSTPIKRLFMGGGGGGGHNNEDKGTGGGNGGGIVFVSVLSIQNQGSGMILANGEMKVTNGHYTDAHDGGGGGGAGGTVVLSVAQNGGKALPIEIKGGNGARVKFDHGHGGGGGGGVLAVSNTINPALLQIDARGGKSGVGKDGMTNLATNGQPGLSRSIVGLPISKEMWQALQLDAVHVEPTCEGSVFATVVTKNSARNLRFSMDGGQNWQNESEFELSKTGEYFVQVSDGCTTLDTQVQIIVPSPLGITQTVVHEICSRPGSVKLQGLGGIPPYAYRISGAPWQDSGQFNALKSQIYTFQLRDQTMCTREVVIEVEDQSYPLYLSPTPDKTIEKGDSFEIGVEVTSPYEPPLRYSWFPDANLSCSDCKTLTVKPAASTIYEVIVVDAYGCTGTDSVQVNVKEVAFYFPTGFNPISPMKQTGLFSLMVMPQRLNG